jgi:hypothetical protein
LSDRDTQHLDVRSLLTIDVSSELRKLTEAQLQGPWQLPAELVRRAIRNGARRIEVDLGRQLITVCDDGEGLEVAMLEQVAVLLDEQRDPTARHAALLDLESGGALALLALAGLEPESLRLVTQTQAGPRALEFERRNGHATIRAFAPPAPTGTRLELRGARLDRSRARAWLTTVCRFARADVILDGRPIPRGFTGSISRRPLRRPLDGVLSIPKDGNDARAWLLRDGVVTTHVTVTPAPCFEVAVEMRELAPPDATAASLRDAVERQLDVLIDQAIDHLIELGRESRRLAPPVRQRVTQLLLEGARQRRRSPEIAQLPLFRGFERNAEAKLEPAWFDLLSIRSAVDQDVSDRVVTALFPDQDPEDYAVGSSAFVLDESERSLLGEILGLKFRQPRRREDDGSLARLVHITSTRVGDAVQSMLAAIWRRTPVTDERLTPAEHRFVQVLRSAFGGQRSARPVARKLVLCEGRGRIRRAGDTLWLPRDNPDVRSAIEAVASDPSWAYPALLGLMGGRSLPSAHARFIWTQARAGG